MDAKLLALCEREFELGVKMLFAALDKSVVGGESWLREAPFIGSPYVAGLEDPDDSLVPLVCAALRAREQFRQAAPSWTYQPLPLRKEDCDELMDSDNTGLQVVGLYGDSWRFAGWDQKHPSFNDYVGGLLACGYAPPELRHDLSWLQEFRPRRLRGLCDGMLHWRSDATIAFDRQHKAWVEGTGPAPSSLQGVPPSG